MERFGENGNPFWQSAYDLAKRGEYLPGERYSPWASCRRGEVAGLLRQSVHAVARLYQARYGEAGEEEALLVLRSYWQEHPRDEDILRPLMELLGRRECFQQATEYYEQLCALLAEEHGQPDQHTQDVAMYLRLKQIQRPPREMRHRSGAVPVPASTEPLPFPVRTLSLLSARPGSIPRDPRLASGAGMSPYTRAEE